MKKKSGLTKMMKRGNCLSYSKLRSSVITFSIPDVLMQPGATQFARMPSFAHSQAKLLESWFMAPYGGKEDTSSSDVAD